jgi:hypothetical protein
MAVLVLACCGNVSDRNRDLAVHWPGKGHFFYNALMNKPLEPRYGVSLVAVAMLMMVFVSLRAQPPPGLL